MDQSTKTRIARTALKSRSRFHGPSVRLALAVLLVALTIPASILERGRSTSAFAESIGTFASADCSTPKADWDLNQTACAVATGTTGPRRIVWIAPDGSIADVSTPFNGSGSDTYTFLTTGPFAQYGTWTVKTVDNSGAGFAFASFLVRNQAIDNVDLVVNKFGPGHATPGNDITYRVEVSNRGPNAAQNVVLTEQTPANTTFVSVTQDAVPSFSCADPSAGCNIGTLAPNTSAIFTFIYNVSAGAPDGTLITNTATVSSDTNELHQADNSATYQTTVVSSAAPCAVTCGGDVTVDNDLNLCGAVVSYSAPTSSGDCGSVACNPPSGSFFPLGATRVSCAGESGDPCGFNVTVNNTQSRAITCPSNITTAENPSGSGSATVNYSSPAGSSCSGETITCIPPSGSSFVVGSTTVNCSSNTGLTCSFTVTVTSATCTMICTGDVQRNNDLNQCGAVVTYSSPTGSCGTVTCSPSSGSVFPIGTTGVSCTGSGGGNCSFSVTVYDVQPPTITCPGNLTATEDSPGFGFATVNYASPTASDNCSNATTSCTPASGSKFPIGTNTVTCTAEDGSENNATCSFTISVNATGCTVVCPASVSTISAPNQCGAVVTYPAATTSGTNCGATVTCTPPSGAFYPVGATSVSCSDGSGHSCGFTVQVLDAQAPVITCPGTTTVTETPVGSGSATVSYTTTATDNCPGLGGVSCFPPSGSTFPVGQTLVTCSVNDASGNTGSCQFVVQVSIYSFQGFFSPVGNPPTLNRVNAGRAVPVKFSLGGNRGLNIFAPGFPVSGEIGCDANATPVDVAETVTAGGSSLSYDATTDTYIYIWKTNSSWAGTCRQLILRLTDGTDYIANFEFR